MNKNEYILLQRKKYRTARVNALTMICLTAVNILTLLTDIGFYFPFSASFPYLLLDAEGLAAGDALSVVLLIVLLLCMASYLLCYFLSARRFSAMVGLLALFAVDFAMLGLVIARFVGAGETGAAISFVIDAVFHCWVLYYLIVGVTAGKRIKDASYGEDSSDVNGLVCQTTDKTGQAVPPSLPEPLVLERTESKDEPSSQNVGEHDNTKSPAKEQSAAKGE